ncbi:MAG: fluoride efflux transporter CrcB [Gammaproteobacteria bacterium]|nr:fluoride efflux transporter CrcB [Gammaproteobacteria bacterium]
MYAVIAICFGASVGALLRWQLAEHFNVYFAAVPLGTLLANFLGAYIIGIALAFFLQYPALSPQWKLLIITGFLGGLTTFSTFSAEVVNLLQQSRWLWALGLSFTHVIGSLCLTVLGMLTFTTIKTMLK